MSQSYLGIDLHKRRSYVVLMDQDGKVLNERNLPHEGIRDYLAEKVPPATTAVREPSCTSCGLIGR